jgi:hypothetical protein
MEGFDSIAEVAIRYEVDASKLRDALSIARHQPEIEHRGMGAARNELQRIAAAAAELASAIEDASDFSLLSLLIGHPDIDVSRHSWQPRRRVATLLKQLRDLEVRGARAACRIKVTKRPASGAGRTSPPTVKERHVVTILEALWVESHGTTANVTGRKEPCEVRKANQGGRFIIAAAELAGLTLTDQRLRTILEANARSRTAER